MLAVATKKQLVISMVAILAIFFATILLYADHKTKDSLCERGTHIATLGSSSFILHALSTPEERMKGLSGREFLGKDEGALFVFDTPTEIGFWMKDMHFPIDIIFLDEAYRVIGLFADVSPESYPKSFISPPAMRYTLEVRSGTIEQEKIVLGSVLGITRCKS